MRQIKKLSLFTSLLFTYFIWAVDIDIANPDDFEAAAKKDIKELALNDQAMMYLLGQGVEKDPTEAVRLFTLSAKQGNQYAQSNLGLIYADGHDEIEPDYEKARYWFEKAVEQGNAYAQGSLGYLYENGLGVEVNFKKALTLYQTSASQGNVLAHRNLGFAYKEGKGIPIDLVRSLMWFLLAGSSGDDVSNYEAGEVQKMLNESKESEAFDLAKRCISSSFSDCGYPIEETIPGSLNFVCDYQREEPLTLQIEGDTIRVGSLDVKHRLDILKRNDSSIEWIDNSYMKLPFDVSHVLDLENSVLKFNLLSRETKQDCLQVEDSQIDEYERDMESVIVEEGWSPRLPPLSMYLKLADDKDHPKVIHQMNLRCESLQFTQAYTILAKLCPDLEMDSEEEEIKKCLNDTRFPAWNQMKINLEYHTNMHNQLNNEGNYLSEEQLDMQASVFMKAYGKSFMKYLKQEENCWGDTEGLLCWEEEENMCRKLKEEKSMQAWFDKVTEN